MDQGMLVEPVRGMGTEWGPLPSEPSQGQEDSESWWESFQAAGRRLQFTAAECSLASASLAFCDFDGQTVSS